MTLKEVNKELDRLGEIHPEIKVVASMTTYQWGGAGVISLRLDNTVKGYGSKGDYIADRFRGVDYVPDELTEKILMKRWKQWRKRIIQVEKDYDIVQKFIKDNIKFEYGSMVIHTNSIEFRPKSTFVYCYISYTIKDGEVVVRDTNGTGFLNIGRGFLDLQQNIIDTYKKRHVAEKIIEQI